MRNFQDLTDADREKILREANRRCYADIARELDTAIATVRKVTRTYGNKTAKQR